MFNRKRKQPIAYAVDSFPELEKAIMNDPLPNAFAVGETPKDFTSIAPSIPNDRTPVGTLKDAHLQVAQQDLTTVENTISDLEVVLDMYRSDAKAYVEYLEGMIAEAKLVRASVLVRIEALDDSKKIPTKKAPKDVQPAS